MNSGNDLARHSILLQHCNVAIQPTILKRYERNFPLKFCVSSMWGNISGVVGAAIQKVQKIQNDIETQLDAAVGVEGVVTHSSSPAPADPASTVNDSTGSSGKSSNIREKSTNGLDGEGSNQNSPKNEDFPRDHQNISSKSSSQRKTPKTSQSATNLPDDGDNQRVTSPSIETANSTVPSAKHEATIKEIKAKAIEKLRTQEAKFNEEKENLKLEVAQLRQKMETELRDMKLQHEKELSTITSSHQVALLKMQQQLESSQKQFELELEMEKSRHQQHIAKQDAEHKERLDQALRTQSLSVASESGVKESSSSENISILEKIIDELREKLKQQEIEASQQINSLSLELHSCRTNVQQCEFQSQDLLLQINSLKESRIELLEDINKMKEIIRERERALEVSVEQASEMRRLHEEAKQKISELKLELADKDSQFRSINSSLAEDCDLKKEIAHYQELLRERDVRLAAFEEEGRSLAKKQSEMEKNVRKSKQDVREKENEILKLKESKDQLIKTIEQTQEALRKNELEALNTSKTLSAMQAVSQASADKLSRLEAEISSKNEELGSQRRALETAWNDNNELKRLIAELKAERDDMKRQLGEGTSKVLETETSRREIEQREAVLRATSRQLQESLQGQMKESSSREERLREEIHEMRRKWQEAVSSRESLASELGQATAPLLRQISSLQEALRIKSEQWQNIESALSERALRAENAVETFEHKKSLLDDQILNLKQQLSITSSRLHDHQSQLHTAESALDRYKRFEISWTEEKHELESKLSLEVAQKNSLQTSLRELEIRHKLDVQNLVDKTNAALAAKDLELSKISKDLEIAQRDLKEERSSKGKKGKTDQAKNDFVVKDLVFNSTDTANYPHIAQTLPSKF